MSTVTIRRLRSRELVQSRNVVHALARPGNSDNRFNKNTERAYGSLTAWACHQAEPPCCFGSIRLPEVFRGLMKALRIAKAHRDQCIARHAGTPVHVKWVEWSA